MLYTNLNEFRKEKGLTITELAREFGITTTHLSMILSGKRFPSRKLALKISEKTGISPINLLYSIDSEHKARP